MRQFLSQVIDKIDALREILSYHLATIFLIKDKSALSQKGIVLFTNILFCYNAYLSQHDSFCRKALFKQNVAIDIVVSFCE